MQSVRTFRQFHHSILALALLGLYPGTTPAQQGHSHETAAQSQLTPSQGVLLKVVRENTVRFKDGSVAQAEGYSPLFGCGSRPDSGAMGMHFVNPSLVASGVIYATRPQVVIYEPMPDGHLQLIGADFLVIASDCDKAHPGPGAPQLMGQLFHSFESPTARVLHRSRGGLERQSQRRLRRLASERLLPILRRPTAEADQEISLRIRLTNSALKSESEIKKERS